MLDRIDEIVPPGVNLNASDSRLRESGPGAGGAAPSGARQPVAVSGHGADPMPARSAIVTGASRGIGRAIAEALGADGYALTLTARKPERLAATAQALAAQGYEVQHLAANVGDEAAIAAVVALHRERHDRLDVLVNNAGVGVGAAAGEHATKFVDLQLAVNLRSIVLFYREALRPAPGRGRRAPPGASRQPRVDRRQVAGAVAVGVLGDQGRGDRLHPAR